MVSDTIKHLGLPPGSAEVIKDNIIRLIVDKPVPADVVDALQAKIKSFAPAVATVEFTTSGDIINVDEAIKNSDLSDVSIEKAINEFVSFIDTTNKDQIAERCLDFYSKCK